MITVRRLTAAFVALWVRRTWFVGQAASPALFVAVHLQEGGDSACLVFRQVFVAEGMSETAAYPPTALVGDVPGETHQVHVVQVELLGKPVKDVGGGRSDRTFLQLKKVGGRDFSGI